MYWVDAYLSMTGLVLTAVSSIIGSVAWPATVALLVLLFRKQIRSALGALHHFEAPGGFKADFHTVLVQTGEAAADLNESVDAGAPAPAAEPAPAQPDDDGDDFRVEVDRTDVILSAWRRLRREILEYAELGGIGPHEPGGIDLDIRWMLHEMEGSRLLGKKETAVLLNLRKLRNSVAAGHHAPTVSEAATFRNTALSMLGLIQRQRDEYLKKNPHLEP